MLKRTGRLALLLSMTLLIAAPPCWAKTKGYLYIISYSSAQKKIFLSQIVTQQVRDVSYSDEEYVTEVELTRKMEAQFQEHLFAAGVNASEYTTAVRGAFKSRAIADGRRKKERDRYLKRGYSATVLTDFKYSE